MLTQEIARVSPVLMDATIQTFQMVLISLAISTIIGIPLGILLVITRKDSILGNHIVLNITNTVLNVLVNFFRAIPFIILMVWIIPITRAFVGTTIGVKGAIFPLIVCTIPFIARLTESAILEINKGIVEAFVAMGASPLQIVRYVLLRESRAGLILALTTTAVTLIGATAIAGAVGAGGLGDTALRYGYQRYDNIMMNAVIIELFIIIQGVQMLGDYISRRLRK